MEKGGTYASANDICMVGGMKKDNEFVEALWGEEQLGSGSSTRAAAWMDRRAVCDLEVDGLVEEA